MKTSNALLILVISISLLLIAAIPVTFRYKVSHGDYKIINTADAFGYSKKVFSGARYFKLSDISDCVIIPSDSIIAEVSSQDEKQVTFQILADTLFIKGNSGRTQRVRLLLPTNSKIDATKCGILLKGGLDPLLPLNYSFNLDSSKLYTRRLFTDSRQQQFLNTLTLSGVTYAEVELSGNVKIDQLDLVDINQFKCDIGSGFKDSEFQYSNKHNVKSINKEGVTTIHVE